MKRQLIVPVVFLGLMLFSAASKAAEPVELVLQDLQGKTHSLEDYRGQWVIVNLWATWCPPCLEEIPEFVVFSEQHADKAIVWGINFESISKDLLAEFVEENFMDYPIFPMKPARKGPFGTVRGLPATYIISPQGVLVKRHVGMINAAQLEAYIQAR